MEISLGFIIVVVLIVFPGLIFRKLYYYGDFSKEFSSGYNIITLLAVSTIPGIINLVTVYFFYIYFFSEIDIVLLINKFKEISSPDLKFTTETEIASSKILTDKILPFLSFLYLLSIITGSLTGRLIRISKLDTKFKLLRFKNYWFYLFNSHHTDFKRMKHLKIRNKRHLFTRADILVESASKTHLYSGIIVDYELMENDCRSLSKIVLHSAERYSNKEGSRSRVQIPGNLFIVECSSMININLTYIFEEAKSLLSSKIPNYFELFFGFLSVIIAPAFLFNAKVIDIELYNAYFELNWVSRFFYYALIIQVLNLLNPFIKVNEDYQYIDLKNLNIKLILVIVFQVILFLSL